MLEKINGEIFELISGVKPKKSIQVELKEASTKFLKAVKKGDEFLKKYSK